MKPRFQATYQRTWQITGIAPHHHLPRLSPISGSPSPPSSIPTAPSRTHFNSQKKPPTPDPTSPSSALSRDVILNDHCSTSWVRLFLHRQALDRPSSAGKLPVGIYYHGGGLVICSAADSIFHNFFEGIAEKVDVMVISVEYSLARRLPAAYEDAVEAIHWVASWADEWVRKFADLSCCFLAGISASGNIAYHTGLRLAMEAPEDISPAKIRGLVLQQPYLVGPKGRPRSSG